MEQSEPLQQFWKDHDLVWWGIETRIQRVGKDSIVKATIMYGKKVVATAHSDLIPAGTQELHAYEQQAIERAVLNCPLGLGHDKIRK
jgi:hypothetical protein